MCEAPNFIIIDDDALSNFITVKTINITVKGASVITFTDPVKGIEYICGHFPIPVHHNPIVLLNVNMPGLSGWEMLDKLQRCNTLINGKLKIFMFSSSVFSEDIERSRNYSFASGYLSKPLSQQKLLIVMQEAYFGPGRLPAEN